MRKVWTFHWAQGALNYCIGCALMGSCWPNHEQESRKTRTQGAKEARLRRPAPQDEETPAQDKGAQGSDELSLTALSLSSAHSPRTCGQTHTRKDVSNNILFLKCGTFKKKKKKKETRTYKTTTRQHILVGRNRQCMETQAL